MIIGRFIWKYFVQILQPTEKVIGREFKRAVFYRWVIDRIYENADMKTAHTTPINL